MSRDAGDGTYLAKWHHKEIEDDFEKAPEAFIKASPS
jgi:hypothetical protein